MIIHALIILACLGTIVYYQCSSSPISADVEKAAELILEEELQECIGSCVKKNDVKK